MIQLPEKHKENVDGSNEGPSSTNFLTKGLRSKRRSFTQFSSSQ
jgi:hypothetical protein